MAATLFDVMHFQDDTQDQSVTSGVCPMVRRSVANTTVLAVTDIETSIVGNEADHPTEDFNPVPEEVSFPKEDDFLAL